MAGVVNTVLKTDFSGLQLRSADRVRRRHVDGRIPLQISLRGINSSTATSTSSPVTRTAIRSTRPTKLHGDERPPLAVRGHAFRGHGLARRAQHDKRLRKPLHPAELRHHRPGRRADDCGRRVPHPAFSQTGCGYAFTNGPCLGTGVLATSAADRDARFDSPFADRTSIIPARPPEPVHDRPLRRLAGRRTYGEAGYYRAGTRNIVASTATLSSVPITVPASSYWNPSGPVTFANGTAIPIPSGTHQRSHRRAARTITGYDFSDAGPAS